MFSVVQGVYSCMLTCVLAETYKTLVGKSLLDVRKGIDSSTQWIGVCRPVLHRIIMYI